MIHKILQEIADPKEYRLALRVVNYEGEALSEEEKADLVALYAEYARDVPDDGVRKALLLVDTTESVMDIEDAELRDLLTEKDLELLKAVGEVIAEPVQSAEKAKAAVKMELKDEGNLCLRAALGRVALDKLAAQVPLADHREDIQILSRFLRNCEDDTLYQGAILVLEVKRKWKR